MRIHQLRQKVQDCMTEYCGVFRTALLIEKGIQEIQNLKAQYERIYLDDKGNYWNQELIEALELRNIIIVGEVILHSAYHRRESRGAHYREDFPLRDDQNFLKHTLAYYSPTGVTIEYMPVVITMFEPQERKY